MQPGDKVQKSANGRAAVANRSANLPAPLRTLLLMIYGDKTASQYGDLASRLPVGREGFQKLVDMGLVEVVPTLGMIAGLTLAASAMTNEPLHAPLADGAEFKATHTLDEAAQQKLLYPEFVRAVADAGLRGMMLQLKVERAMSATELLALRDQVEAALGKAKGELARKDFSDRLDALLSKFYWR